jgi:threonine synthase
MRDVVQTTSPSMDIQISSNFERLLFEASGRDAAYVRRAMETLIQSRQFALGDAVHGAIATDFAAGRADTTEAGRTISHVLDASGYLLDPHTAVATHVARARARAETPMIVLATAHPAKFPDAVEDAAGIRPELPAWLGDLMGRRERFAPLPSDLKMVEDYISARTRAAGGSVGAG